MRDVIEERMEKTKQVRVELHFADREVSKKEREMYVSFKSFCIFFYILHLILLFNCTSVKFLII